jgi:hypothetical protein
MHPSVTSAGPEPRRDVHGDDMPPYIAMASGSDMAARAAPATS